MKLITDNSDEWRFPVDSEAIMCTVLVNQDELIRQII